MPDLQGMLMGRVAGVMSEVGRASLSQGLGPLSAQKHGACRSVVLGLEMELRARAL